MKHIFVLNKEDLRLAKAEVEALVDSKGKLDGDLLIADVSDDLVSGLCNRLAYTRKILNVLFICEFGDLKVEIDKFDFNSVYEKNFSVRKFGESLLDEKNLAGLIWNRLKGPSVDLKNAKTQIEFYFNSDKVYCGLVLCDVKSGFESRGPHLKPVLHPTSIKPRLARACINLTGASSDSVVVDPFCGVGGILVEAGLIGCKVRGYDINPWMIKAAEKNLKHYRIEDYKLVVKDSTKLTGKVGFLVTDLPYGKNSKISDELNKLYGDFLDRLGDVLVGKAVVIFPKFKGTRLFNYKKYIKEKLSKKLKIEKEFDYYIHKSLSKKIVVISPI